MSNIFQTQIDSIKGFLDEIKVTKYKLSLWAILQDFFLEMSNDNVLAKSQAMAFNFILAVFPGMIFFFTLIPYIPIPNLDISIMVFLRDSVPPSIYQLLADTVQEIVSKPRGDLLSFGFILALYAAMNGTGAMIDTFNQCYKTKEKRGFFQSKLIAATLTCILVGVLLSALVILNIGEYLLLGFHNITFLSGHVMFFVNVFRYGMLLLMYFVATSMIYAIAPTVSVKWGLFSTGAIIATVTNAILSYSFSVYINNFASYNKLYGSIGTIIAMMLWFYMTSLVILIGFEFNASIDSVRNNVLTEESTGDA